VRKKVVIVLTVTVIVLAVFLAGCGWDFGPVEEGYRGVFDYNPQAEVPQTTTFTIEGDLAILSNGATNTTNHISSAKNMWTLINAAPAYVYVLYNGRNFIGYFNEGEKNVFYVSTNTARQNCYIRRDSGIIIGPGIEGE
jgi:hypothetical protein